MTRPVYAVILAGGSGTRFWPASRRLRPKQLLAIDPSTESTLIAATVERLSHFCTPERIIIATGEALLPATREILHHLPESSFLGEPQARNTAACIGWATSVIRKRDPEALIMVVPSDQAIAGNDRYRIAIERALASAMEGVVTTIGIRPTRGETGYGYIELGAALGEDTFVVSEFKEKPDQATADKYAQSGKHLWNAGMFFFLASTMQQAIEAHLPALAEGLKRIEAAEPDFEHHVTREIFPSLPSVSIDHGVIEKLSPLHVVAGDFEWSDLGSWHTAWELAEKDGAGNAARGDTLFVEAEGNLVFDLRSAPGDTLTAVLGVGGLCVVQTDDALLIMKRERAQDVRKIVDELKSRGHHHRV
ncbi:MAG: sugar phosphate nucleotidyltransferase [Polyangiaceae bacterium]|nr:sugar phosphate nucleotidyltransferase [Polyangiaceae bacterium]